MKRKLELRQIEYDDTIIKAPISGTILEKLVEEGQVITSRLSSLASEEGQTLVTMADLDTVYVVTEVDETDIGKVEIGQPVTITVEAYPDTTFQGEVLKIAPQGLTLQNVTTFEVTSEPEKCGSLSNTARNENWCRKMGWRHPSRHGESH